MTFNSLIPELSVSNIEESKKFYKGLGFKVLYERKEDKFCFLEYGSNQIMIEQINNHWNTGILEYPFGRGINISMNIQDIKKFYYKLKRKKFIFYKELMINTYMVNDTEYQDSEFLIQDPDGYLLRFNS